MRELAGVASAGDDGSTVISFGDVGLCPCAEGEMECVSNGMAMMQKATIQAIRARVHFRLKKGFLLSVLKIVVGVDA